MLDIISRLLSTFALTKKQAAIPCPDTPLFPSNEVLSLWWTAVNARKRFFTTNPFICGTMSSFDILILGGSCGHFAVADILGTAAPDLYYDAVALNSMGQDEKPRRPAELYFAENFFYTARSADLQDCKNLVQKLSNGRLKIETHSVGNNPNEKYTTSILRKFEYFFRRYYKHDSRLFLLWFQKICDKNATIVEVKIGHPERKYGWEEVTILSNKPSLTEVQEIYKQAIEELPGVCGMHIEMMFEDPSFNHAFNLWPKPNEKGENTFEIHELIISDHGTSSTPFSLSQYFSGTSEPPRSDAVQSGYGFYLFHFIVDQGN